MRFLDVVGSRRMAVTVLATITGIYYLIVAITNCTDTDTNRRGVSAVLSMRQTIHHPSVDWHAITNGTAVWIAYVLVVIWEFLIALVLLSAAVAWIRTLRGRPAQALATKLSTLGWTMVIVLFVGGFLTIGGEWFRMWANKEVNASSAALQNFLIAGIGLVLVHLPDRDVPAPPS
ncbi:DUF2165 domain-containing protein [Nocardia pseudobrasiliensis]|uniref:Putative small integral membrane protein n=1 Tax=Nocardia pseudobrasiliensis TaxID=45979 RepID=A0A370IA79_9NOCA|nr:DUF2165 domain-containing protein [Nocardia pseudobrasiliensis]RDI67622.1 putative small integral membrane protein [Nocardia pseudobrasiliensis]